MVEPARLAELTWPDLAGPPRPLLIPVGSTEQHGPHLPLDTDTRLAVAFAEAAAARCGGLVAPALAYGSAGEHRGFPGTLSIGRDALQLVVVELARSAGPQLHPLVIVNGHGGNQAPLAAAADLLRSEGRPLLVWSPLVVGGDLHAGRTETSLMLAIAPETVRLDRAEAGDRRPLGELWPQLRRDGVAAVSPNGVLGDPAGASAAEGRELFQMLVASLAHLVEGGG